MSIYLGTTPLSGLQNLNTKADINLGNLNSTGKNISNWSSNVTNCITYIPQDIKLELNNGTLTLKAGSKVYVPNGAGVFDIVTVESDKTKTLADNGTYFAVLSQDGTFLGQILTNGVSSGSLPTGYTGWLYNTSDNILALYNNGVVSSSQFSLPFAIFTVSGGAITSIDQVFNGFGYVGSTVYALPGVKGLIPDGRNEDGTLKSTETTSSSVYINTPSWNPSRIIFTLATGGLGLYEFTDIEYIESKNRLFFKNDNTYPNHCFAGIAIYDSNGKITSFSPKTAFHALDYNDKSTISGWCMPSDSWTSLTLLASGQAYTLPGNGYICLSSTFNSAGYLYIYRSGNRYGYTLKYDANVWVDCCLYGKKGTQITIQYIGTPSVQAFGFIYTEGEL